MYDYKSSLTGIGNRSSVDNFDDTIFLVSLLRYESVINVKKDVSVLWRATWSLASVWNDPRAVQEVWVLLVQATHQESQLHSGNGNCMCVCAVV